MSWFFMWFALVACADHWTRDRECAIRAPDDSDTICLNKTAVCVWCVEVWVVMVHEPMLMQVTIYQNAVSMLLIKTCTFGQFQKCNTASSNDHIKICQVLSSESLCWGLASHRCHTLSETADLALDFAHLCTQLSRSIKVWDSTEKTNKATASYFITSRCKAFHVLRVVCSVPWLDLWAKLGNDVAVHIWSFTGSTLALHVGAGTHQSPGEHQISRKAHVEVFKQSHVWARFWGLLAPLPPQCRAKWRKHLSAATRALHASCHGYPWSDPQFSWNLMLASIIPCWNCKCCVNNPSIGSAWFLQSNGGVDELHATTAMLCDSLRHSFLFC